MTFSFWLRNLTHSLATTLKNSHPSAARARRGNSRFSVEPLEHRCLLSAGTLDPTFGSGGVVTTALAGTQQGQDVAIYPTGTANAGKIVVGGGQSGGDPSFLLLRYNANGTLDTSFDQDGVVTTNFERNNRYEAITAVAIQPDGKIVAAGTATTNVAGVGAINPNWRLARYNTNGTLDKTFDTDGKVTLFAGAYSTSVRDMLIQPDGKIVVIGGNNDQAVIVRFLANGKLDTSFDGDGIATVASIGFRAVALQTDGKLVVGGSIVSWVRLDDKTTPANESRVFETSAFWRFNLNGSLDGSFGTNGRFVLNLNDADRDGRVEEDDRAKAVVIQPADGKIVALIDPGVVTVRIDSTGALDTSYGTSGIARTSGGYIAPGRFFVSAYAGQNNTALVVQADGKPVVAVSGQYADLNPDGITYSPTPFAAVLRYSPNGVLDNTWASTTQVTGTASGTGPVNGTLHWGDAFTFTAPTGAVTEGDTITATFTVANPITLSGDVAGQVTGTLTGTALRTLFNATEETWRVSGTDGTATGTVTGSVAGTVSGGDTVTGAIVVSASGTAATITDTTKGTVVGTNSGALTGRFASQFTVTGTVTGAVTGGIVRNLNVRAGYHVALQPDGKVVIMGYNADGSDVVMARYKGDSALLAASTPAHSRSTTLTAAQVQPLLAEALARWEAAGVDTSALHGIDVRIADLGGATLGLASGPTITLDDNAAGWGWFVDATPGDDSEFTTPGNQGEQHRMDLLTVLEHELGHLLDQHHDAGGVMTETLATGVRQTDLQHDHFALTDQLFDHSGDPRVNTWLDDSLAKHREFTRLGSIRLGSKRRR